MGTVTVINTTPYKLQPVPEVGQEYHIFDDGKIRLSRHYTAKTLEAIPFNECQDTDLVDAWKSEVEEAGFLFAEETDYFIKAASSFDKNPLYFVRTVDGGWFSIDYPNWWMGARLDMDGSMYKKLKEWEGIVEE